MCYSYGGYGGYGRHERYLLFLFINLISSIFQFNYTISLNIPLDNIKLAKNFLINTKLFKRYEKRIIVNQQASALIFLFKLQGLLNILKDSAILSLFNI
ncbi:hypothetical protein BpHYR1_041957 [Brachionus plicatilis]|uniref:Uncharacterized protein n=1 Tax=Brachionus plicatilis TaxID=10195 RepID=A0A3M7R8R1_BRAPC|nr:hypothetical protein BpHYR1_041957 [Brachionus plicatilis]